VRLETGAIHRERAKAAYKDSKRVVGGALAQPSKTTLEITTIQRKNDRFSVFSLATEFSCYASIHRETALEL